MHSCSMYGLMYGKCSVGRRDLRRTFLVTNYRFFMMPYGFWWRRTFFSNVCMLWWTLCYIICSFFLPTPYNMSVHREIIWHCNKQFWIPCRKIFYSVGKKVCRHENMVHFNMRCAENQGTASPKNRTISLKKYAMIYGDLRYTWLAIHMGVIAQYIFPVGEK